MADSTWSEIKDVVGWAGQIIKDGQPVAGLPTQMASAVPKVDDWTALTDVQGPNSLTWDLPTFTNAYGVDCVTATVKLYWQFGARYQGGGAYIPNVWVEIPSCQVKWPQKVNLSFRATHPANAGSAQAPNASIHVTISGKVSNWFQDFDLEYGYTLFGDGHYQS